MLDASLHSPASYCLFFVCYQDDIDDAIANRKWPCVFLLDNHLKFNTALLWNSSFNQYTHRMYWSNVELCEGCTNLYHLQNVIIDELVELRSFPWGLDAYVSERIVGHPDGLVVIYASEPISVPEDWIDLEPYPVDDIITIALAQRSRLRLRRGFLSDVRFYLNQSNKSVVYKDLSYEQTYDIFVGKGYLTHKDLNTARRVTT